MKLILTQDVNGLGAPGDIVEVKDGYGRNFLLPRGMALPWSRGGEKQIGTIKRSQDARAIRDLGHANEVKAQLAALSVKLEVRAGDAGRLFGAFQRLHHVSDFPGTGIGLTIVQRIIRRHGGEIRAEASAGAGATFFFNLKEAQHGSDEQDHPAG